jgi:hypothetical protein
MRTARLRTLLLAAACAGVASSAPAAEPAAARAYCQALGRAVDQAAPGNGPAFVESYQPGPSETAVPEALRTSAFSYDNAAAAIALISCGDGVRAQRIADAFVSAIAQDRTFTDGRIRNAYRAGAVAPGPAKLPGWWDASANRWDEDAYQDGTSTGNVAWVALALLNVHGATHNSKYLETAARLLAWIKTHTADAPGPQGFAGGLSGFDGSQTSWSWKSTEHNIDVAAAAAWMQRLTHDPSDGQMAEQAASFVASRFRAGQNQFLIGTKPDGSDADADHLALDVQVWPILGVPHAPAAWKRAIGFADAHLRRGDGMTFAGFGPNRWTEGTAQAALAFRAVGGDAIADSLLGGLPDHTSPSGLLYATSAGEVPTGLQVESQGGGEFKYFHRPHLGATAWAALAANGWNPFTGKKVG